jgi:hypothetical protein
MSIGYLSQNGMNKVFNQFTDYDPNLNQYGFGQLYNENGKPKIEQVYAGMWINPTQTIVTSDYAIQRNYEILIYDLVFISEAGESNQNKVVSDCEEIAFRLVRFLKNKSDVFDISGTPTIAPFSDRWLDAVSGVIVNLSLIFNGESSTCEDPDYSFDIVTNILDDTATTPTITVYSQVLDFISPDRYNSINYKCDGTTVQSCYGNTNQFNMTDLVNYFNSNPGTNPGCNDPQFCLCWSDYGTYYDNGDGRIRCEMPVSVYNNLCSGGTLTLDIIYD